MASKFTPMTKCPSATNKYFINYKNGGYSAAIAISADGYTLPNCVGLSAGRLAQLDGQKKVDWSIPVGNPDSWIAYANKNGRKTSTKMADIRLGAQAVFDGHVGSVEKIYENGDFEMYQSHYGGVKFDHIRITKASGYSYNGMKFLGFVYPKADYGTGDLETEATKKLTATSYSDYPSGSGQYYRVRTAWGKGVQIGAYSVWKNAYNCYNKYKDQGYHVYDNNGGQLD